MGRKFIIYILLFSSFITFIGTGLQLYFDFNRDLKSIYTIFKQVESSYNNSIINSLWVTDVELLRIQLEGILRLPDIQLIEVSNGESIIATIGTPQTESIIKKSFPLVYVYNGQDIHLGELHIIASLKGIYARIFDRILVILSIQTVKTFIVSLFIFTVFYQLMGRHIIYMASFVESVGFESMDQPLHLYKKPEMKEPDELDQLTAAFNRMRENLVRDITDRKQAEDALATEKERLAVTLRSIGDGVISTDTNGNIVMLNKVAEKLTGWSQKEAHGKDIKIVFNIINVKTRKKCESLVKKVLEAKTIVELANHTNLISREGTERVIADSGAPIFDANSKIIGVILVFRDVTEKHKIEKQLQQSQKMEAIGTLAGGIAHDFNNMLSVITGNISYALSDLDLNKDEELYALLSDVQASSKQAQALTSQLLTFSKGGAPIKKVSDINSLIKESAIFSVRGAKTNCSFNLSQDLWTTEIDEGQINQVIGNLVINANQAMPNGGNISIRTENTEIDDDSPLPLLGGKHIKILVEDQGVGISKKHLSKIFEPYFTTKQKGSGLGLATTYSIINNHGGHIIVYSEIEKGTVFHIYLPASTKDVGNVGEKEETKHAGQGKILIMDDQESILKMLGRMLNRMGYETILAMDGSQAVELYRDYYQSENYLDLVILDLTVPGGMGGLKTIIELLKIDPNVKAVVSSGYSNDPIMANYEDYGFCGIAPKPYTKAQLSEVLNKIFNEKLIFA